MRNEVAVAVRVIGPIYTQRSLAVVWSLAIFPTSLVGVRRAEFTLQFPQQVREFRTRADTLDHGGILGIDGVPIDARHVFTPELFALQAPRFCEHLLPLGGRLHRDFYAMEIKPAVFPAWVVALFRPGEFFACFQDAEVMMRSVDQCLAVT